MDRDVAEVGQVWLVRDFSGIIEDRVVYLTEKRDRFIEYFMCIDLERGLQLQEAATVFCTPWATRLA